MKFPVKEFLVNTKKSNLLMFTDEIVIGKPHFLLRDLQKMRDFADFVKFYNEVYELSLCIYFNFKSSLMRQIKTVVIICLFKVIFCYARFLSFCCSILVH